MTARFRYRAADAAGTVVEGDLESSSRHEAIEDLRRRQLYPFDIFEVGSTRRGSAVTESRRGRMSLPEALAVWTRVVATMLSAGVPLERALSFPVADVGNDLLGETVAGLRQDLRDGSSLAAAMRKQPRIFSTLYVAMVSAGEETGALDQVMGRLADNLDESAELRARVRGALLYPALMAFVAAIGVTVILLFVVPRFVAMLGEVGGALPLSTRLLIGLSDVVTRLWWVFMLLAALAFIAARRWIAVPSNRLQWDAVRLGLPVTGALERTQIAARFTRSMGLLQQSGIGILSSLRIARSGISNMAVAGSLERAAEGVAQGRRLGTELQGILPPLAIQLIALGEETGRLGELSLRAAESFERDVSRRLRTLIGLLEPVLIILFGLIVGFVALAMLQAIYSINANVL
ncbi:MAG TPA: type II secretion system F family protein [Gemmatimonadaceae bacterium]|nr:type II secretion system F family protein [Gemmatimonadaceae bacterium]